MRFYEIAIKPIKPLTPAKARVRSLQINADRAKEAMRAERDAQRRQRERERQRKEQQKRAAM
jgi:hypothetical protein